MPFFRKVGESDYVAEMPFSDLIPLAYEFGKRVANTEQKKQPCCPLGRVLLAEAGGAILVYCCSVN